MSSFTFLVSWLVDWAQRGMLAGTSTDVANPASWPQGSQISSKVTRRPERVFQEVGQQLQSFL